MAKANHVSQQRNLALMSWFDRQVFTLAQKHGGFDNSHAHLCRAYTLEPHFLDHIGTTPIEASALPLSVKQQLVGDFHNGPAYTEKSLRERISHALEMQIAFGTRRTDTNIDATPDLPEDGLLAIRVANELKREFQDRIELNIAPTPIFGFKLRNPDTRDRWRVFQEAARVSDYLSLLPEKDAFPTTSDPQGRLGFLKHIRMGLELAHELGKTAQFHVDQKNHPDESGTEWLLDVLDVIGVPQVNGIDTEPTVWAIHVISPSAYDECRFRRLVERLLQHNVGVIVCPSAALSMRQLRPGLAPTHNSIARVLELVKSGVRVKIGSDNIQDALVPASDGDMLTEVKIAANSLRLYSPSVWAKLACGVPLNNVDKSVVGRVLYQDLKAYRDIDPNWE